MVEKMGGNRRKNNPKIIDKVIKKLMQNDRESDRGNGWKVDKNSVRKV